MNLDFTAVGLPEIESVAAALESGRLRTPLTKMALLQYTQASPASREALASTAALGLEPHQAAALLRAIAAERRRTQRTRDSVELVWTGPALDEERSRDTSVVVRDLFRTARREVLVSTYSIAKGEGAELLFGELATRMDAEPDLRVRLVVTILRQRGEDHALASEVVRRFSEDFRKKLWPGGRIPAVFHFPGALAGDGNWRAMHAKCVVIDDERAFVSSANFTEAAHYRNIEAGVLVDDPAFATQLRTEFDVLIANRHLEVVAGLGE